MFSFVQRMAPAWCAVVVLVGANSASAQWFPFAMGRECNCSSQQAMTVSAAPMTTACAQPVVQTCYQTVPVTEYQQVKQVVKKPVVETKYVSEDYVEYRPVTETRKAMIPTVTYQDVQECQTVYRDAGYWVTQYQPNCKLSPCQVDGRPGFMGWMNRTRHEITSAFTPAYTANRQYVPRTVAQTIPTTRKVAIQTQREVAYNVTNWVAENKTRQVAVNSVRYEDTEVTALQPVTVMRTVPIGTQTVMAPYGVGGTQSAFLPYGYGAPRTVLAPIPENGPIRSANGDLLDRSDPDRSRNAIAPTPVPAKKTSFSPDQGAAESGRVTDVEVIVPVRRTSTPTAVAVSRWNSATATNSTGPELPEISLAKTR